MTDEQRKALEAEAEKFVDNRMKPCAKPYPSSNGYFARGLTEGYIAAAEPREAEIERLHSILKQAMPMFYDALPDICDDTDKWFETRDRLCAEYEALAPKKGPSDE